MDTADFPRPSGTLIKGNFTQKQFEALGKIWDNLPRPIYYGDVVIFPPEEE